MTKPTPKRSLLPTHDQRSNIWKAPLERKDGSQTLSKNDHDVSSQRSMKVSNHLKYFRASVSPLSGGCTDTARQPFNSEPTLTPLTRGLGGFQLPDRKPFYVVFLRRIPDARLSCEHYHGRNEHFSTRIALFRRRLRFLKRGWKTCFAMKAPRAYFCESTSA